MSCGIYEPLNPHRNEIRRMVLEPSKQRTAEIECFLEVVSLDDQPDYAVFSYVWGDALDRETIRVNGEPLQITKNLHALLREHRRKRMQTWVWADAICINQADVEEKAHQVSLMGRIFVQATYVLWWLGPADQHTKLALRCLQIIDSGEDLLGEITDAHLRALVTIINRPFWSRLWILQEIILPPGGDLHCGKYILPFSGIISASNYLYRNASNRLTSFEREFHQNVIDVSRWDPELIYYVGGRLEYILVPIIFKHYRERRDGILFSLDSCRASNCSDPRDRIFALLGMFPEYRDVIQVDYAASIDDVYAHAAFEIMKHLGSLDSLALASSPRDQHLSPASWIPDWRAPQEPWAMAYGSDSIPYGSVLLHESQLFNACAGRSADIELIEPYTVRTKALLLGHVKTLGAFGHALMQKPPDDYWFDALPNLAESVRLGDEHLSPNFSWEKAVFSTISRDTKEEKGVDVRLEEKDHEKFDIAQLLRESGSAFANVDSETVKLRKQHCGRFATSMVYVRLCRLSDGSIGQVPDTVHVGDPIFILAGARVPYLLRPSESATDKPTFTVLGPCFIYGIMDGEAVVDGVAFEDIYLH